VIEWLNEGCTKACITKGHWWWRRTGYAELRDGGWLMLDGPDGELVSGAGWNTIWRWSNGDHYQRRELERRAEARIWHKPTKLPRAKLLK